MNLMNRKNKRILFIRLAGSAALIFILLFWYFGVDKFSDGGKVFYGLITICTIPAALLLVFGRVNQATNRRKKINTGNQR